MRSLPLFFVLAFTWTWTCWLTAGFATPPGRTHSVLMLAGQSGPLLSAVVLTLRRSSPAARLSRLVQWRSSPAVYAFAICFPPATYYAAICIKRLFSPNPHPIAPFSIPYDVIANFFIVALTGGPLGEEIGWRGFAWPRLRAAGLSPFRAAIFLGVLWAAWHLPLWWIDHAFHVTAFAVYVLACIGLSHVMGRVYDFGRRRNALACVAFHASLNTWWCILHDPMEWAFRIWVAILWLLVFADVVVTRARRFPASHPTPAPATLPP